MPVQIQHYIDFTYINSFIWNSCDIIFDITIVNYIMTFTCINTCTYLSGFIHQVQQILVHPDRQELGLSVCCQLYTVRTVSGSVISFILKIIWRLNIYLLLQVKWFIYKTFAECRLNITSYNQMMLSGTSLHQGFYFLWNYVTRWQFKCFLKLF